MSTLHRKTHAHKGDHGSVLIIGGSELYHGAPILTALGAEKTGVDLIYLLVPPKHESVVRHHGLNFIVDTFAEDHLTEADLGKLVEWTEKSDVVILGNGLGKNPETQKTLIKFLDCMKPWQGALRLVLDADALIPEILKHRGMAQWILTPHRKEFNRIFEKAIYSIPLSTTGGSTEDIIGHAARQYKCTLLVKGYIDCIASLFSHQFHKNHTGCPQMTVGGTGDVLAGIVGGLWARGMDSFEATCMAAELWGKCGETLAQERENFSAHEMLQKFQC